MSCCSWEVWIQYCPALLGNTALWLLADAVFHIIYSVLVQERLGQGNGKWKVQLFLREYRAKVQFFSWNIQGVLDLCGYVDDMRFKGGQTCHASGNCHQRNPS